jgi:hypothetical protein
MQQFHHTQPLLYVDDVSLHSAHSVAISDFGTLGKISVIGRQCNEGPT